LNYTQVMPQISLYIEKETLETVEKAAQAEELSISKWIGKQLIKSLKADYPDDFENLFGSITDENFTMPERYK
jgi:molybdopterin-guanine dinucleotide biosynthesis protein A